MRAYDDFVDLLVQTVDPHTLAQFEFSSPAKRRVEELRRRQENRHLSPEEATELQRFDAADHLLKLARTRFQQRLASE